MTFRNTLKKFFKCNNSILVRSKILELQLLCKSKLSIISEILHFCSSFKNPLGIHSVVCEEICFRKMNVCVWSCSALDSIVWNCIYLFSAQLQTRCPFLPNQKWVRAYHPPQIYLSTNQKIQLIHSTLSARMKWTTGNGIFMSFSSWPIYKKIYPPI